MFLAMSLSSLVHVDFKKLACCCVKFKGQEPHNGHTLCPVKDIPWMTRKATECGLHHPNPVFVTIKINNYILITFASKIYSWVIVTKASAEPDTVCATFTDLV